MCVSRASNGTPEVTRLLPFEDTGMEACGAITWGITPWVVCLFLAIRGEGGGLHVLLRSECRGCRFFDPPSCYAARRVERGKVVRVIRRKFWPHGNRGCSNGGTVYCRSGWLAGGKTSAVIMPCLAEEIPAREGGCADTWQKILGHPHDQLTNAVRRGEIWERRFRLQRHGTLFASGTLGRCLGLAACPA